MPGGASVPDWGVGHYERTAQMLAPAAQVLVDAAAPGAGERVLDLGAGTGNVALLAAEAGAHVTAVDPSPRLLSVAAGAAHDRGLSIACEVGDASCLPADDGSVDCVLSNFALIFAADADAAVREVVRVLDARGRAAFTAWLPGGAVGALAAAMQDLVRSATGPPPAASRFSWHDESAVTEIFSRHGMSTVACGLHELVFEASSPAAYLDAELRTHPMAVAGFQLLQQMGKAEQAREQLLHVLIEHNEDPDSFRSTSRYVVFFSRPV